LSASYRCRAGGSTPDDPVAGSEVVMRASSWASGVLLATAFLLGSPGADRSPVDAAGGCPESPVTLADLIALQAQPGPLAEAYPPGVGFINERARACYGHATLRMRVFVNGTGGIGGASAYSIRPLWLFSPSLIVFPSDAEVEPGVGQGPFTGLYVSPGFADLQSKYARSWVTITGHFMDSRASSCRATGAVGETPGRAQAIRICQSVFVLSSIHRQGDEPDTATLVDARPSRTPSADPRQIATAALAFAAGAVMWLRRGWHRRGRAAAH
jgi:hypothetical protein